MPFAKLISNHIRDGLNYGPNTILSLDSDTLSSLISGGVAAAAADQGTWSAISYALGDFVKKADTGIYYWANATAISTDVPGVSSKWVAVQYQSPAAGVSSGVANSEGDNFKFQDGSFYLKTPTGALRKPGATDDAEGAPGTVAIVG